MPSNFNAPLNRDQIKIGYIDPKLGFIDGVSICEANNYAQKNPGTTFIVKKNRGKIEFLNINEVNRLNTDILVTDINSCSGIQTFKECGSPTINFFGGGGIAAAGNPIIGSDGAILGVDLISGGYGYQYTPLIGVQDDCYYGSGSKLVAVLGTTVDEYEVFTDEEDFEEYEICDDTEEGYGTRWGPNGEDLGSWDPTKYTNTYEDPIRKEIEKYQKYLLSENNPFFTTRKNKPYSITSSKGQTFSNKIDVTCPSNIKKPDGSSAWSSFMNTYAISPVSPSDTPGSDYADVTFNIEYNVEFPYDGDYTFRGSCDNQGKLYIDDNFIGNLDGFANNPTTIQKKYNQGKHIIKLELINKPLPSSPKSTEIVDFTVYGQGGSTNTLSFSFVSEDGKDTFTINGARKSKETRIEKIKIRPGVRYKVTSKENNTKYRITEQGLIQQGTKNTEGGLGSSNKIFADYTGSANDNDDIQITSNLGRFFSSNKRKVKGENKRSTYDLVYVYDPSKDTPSQTPLLDVIENSWNQNPMGVSLTIESPKAPVPKEPLPTQEGPCPPNPFWTTRFPGAAQQWYPVVYTAGNAWSKFTNRYALSPVPPLDTPGSDRAGLTFKNSWTVDVPYDGYYGFKGTADNKGKLFVDGEKIIDLQGFRNNNPTITKKFIRKGKHTIEIEVYNQPIITTTNVNQKIFSTKDWQSALPKDTEIDFTVYGQGGKTDNLAFTFVSEDGRHTFTINGVQKSKQTRVEKITILPNVNYKVTAKSDLRVFKYSEQGLIQQGTKNKEGSIGTSNKIFADHIGSANDNNDIQITVNRGTFTSSNKRKGSSGRSTYDLTFRYNSSSTVSANQTSTSQITYQGPTLFHHIQTTGGSNGKGWGTFMNDYSVSPKVFRSISDSDRRINGLHTLTWKNVTFPESGDYDIRFQADNIAVLKIGNKEVQRTASFFGDPNLIKTYVSKGSYDITIELTNIPDRTNIFKNNPMGVALLIERVVNVSEASTQQSWAGGNPMAASAVMIPPPCKRKRSGRGVVVDVIVEDPGNGYLSPAPDPNNYDVILRLKNIVVKNSGINYNCGVDQIVITPNNGVKLDYTCDSFGRIQSVTVLDKGSGGFTSYPSITMPSDTGVNVEFAPVFEIVRDPIEAPADQIIQVTDLVGLKQTGYIDGRAYYGAVFYKDGLKYAGYYETPGKLVQVYDTLQESVTGRVTTAPSAIPRVGTDVSSNNPQLNIPGTPNTISET